ncbi:sigma-54-dependent Fis family transcriptional regulator [Deltaproteobacteria bacterium OttesenSCG-928-K17]|nr:sigma-54-dependent Fis family transcriptional regulator [Deltaproteobacteria bacterium OttesenSCG-928-K17]
MQVDPNEFFKKLTLAICSSLDLNLALKRSLEYLQQVFPVEELLLNIIDDKAGAVHVVSRATYDDSKPQSEVVSLPVEFWNWLKNRAPTSPMIMTENILKDVPPGFLQYFPNRCNPEAEMVIPLNVDNVKIGVMIVYAPEEFHYREEHLNLMISVAEPFTLALSNSITYQQLVQYRDMLIDDKDFLQKELIISDRVIGEQEGLATVMNQVNQVAAVNNTVLIQGETGVGKEVIANAIHQRSGRRAGPFIKVNCGAISETLIDSELFGYEKGAFTGATSQRRGRFERANGGTIFLDEVGELSLNAQVRLLRVLATHEIERVGGNKVIPVDIRVITATHRDLSRMVAEGRFREDLWFRLNVFPIMVPPLRERRGDIPALVRHFMLAKSRELGISPPALAPGGLTRLMAYDWPGNVRELENVVERELIRSPYKHMTFESLEAPPLVAAPPRPAPEPVEAEGPESILPLDEAMKKHILKALKKTKGRISGEDGAAELLKIHPNTLRSRMEKFGVHYKGSSKN